MMKYCKNCSKKNSGTFEYCSNCIKNPFNLEKLRNYYALGNNLSEFSKTYNSRYPEITNINTPKFWDKRFAQISLLSSQDGMTKDRVKTVFSFIPKGAEKILDIGAGQGFLEEILCKSKNKKIFANDFSKLVVENLKKRFNGNFQIQSIYKLNYSANYFDVICVLEVLEHIPPRKVLKVLSSVSHLLKRRGILIVSVPMNEGLERMKDNPNGHVRDYTESIITAELKISGFKIIDEKKFHAFKNFYIVKKIISKILKNKWSHNNIVIKAIKI